MPSSKISNKILENLHKKEFWEHSVEEWGVNQWDVFYMKKYETTKQSSHTSLNSELTLILNSLNNKGSIYYKTAYLIQKELTKKKPPNEITNYFNRSYYE
ncbi:12854_t:CDS:2, partial [Gigaspora margarita]